ncbi:vanadium-dependent haloperoxidase [Methylomicrobium lacus]|uniref:vanadium-dependent haloperoxidase n=1 Tax=Methylomicrobium lacus TaxID=136992 RepID=UPI0035A8334B
MKTLASPKTYSRIALAVAATLSATQAFADAVTDWNEYTILATKGATSLSTGDKKIALNSNVATRLHAIEARAVFDAVNAVDHFSRKSYYAQESAAPGGLTARSASAAAAQAAYDVLIGALPNNESWAATRQWLQDRLESDLTGVNASDPGIAAGHQAAAAALAARQGDNAAIRTTYTPSTNLFVNESGAVAPNATGNPGVGLWRPSNGSAGDIDPSTGSPTGFVGGIIQPAAAIDFNWKNVAPFSLSLLRKQQLVAEVPPSLKVGSAEYAQEVDFVKTHGQDSAHPGNRSDDQLLQALYYKSDAEVFVNEAARIASAARNLTLDQNAKLFAALDNALADARIAAWQSKYDLVFWRPITAINADASGAVANYDWKPLATTPSHPSSTSGHSATVAAGTEILRAFFRSDNINPGNTPVTLTTLPWLIGTNNGTGQLQTPIGGQDGTTRDVSTFSELQLENGQSRIYLGVHFGIDNYQGQSLGLAVADAIIHEHKDPATKGLAIYKGKPTVASARNLYSLLVKDSANSGFFGRDDYEGKPVH